MADRDVPKPFPSGDELPDYDPGELPEDPDTDHVPPELQALDGRTVTISGIDRNTGQLVHLDGELVTVPGLHGDVARRDQDCTP